MAESLNRRAADRHVMLRDVRPEMAKVGLSDVNAVDVRRLVAAAFKTAIRLCDWDIDKTTADKLDIHASDLTRWCSGERPVQIDKVMAVSPLNGHFSLALFKLSGGRVEIVARMEHTA